MADRDPVVEALVALIADTRSATLKNSDLKLASTHLIDSVGCAIGALDSRAANACRDLATISRCDSGASIIGYADRTTPELAAFANSSLIRNLDFNDTGIGGHPSDMLGAILAVAETSNASGVAFFRAIHCAYEVFAGLRRAGMRLRGQHVDQLQVVIGAVSGCALLLNLSDEQTRHAISMALVPNIPLRVTRTGALSEWKGSATAHAAMTAVFAARLAHHGMTAPALPFVGIAGLYDLLQIEPFDASRIQPQPDSRSALASTALKRFPAEYSAQGPIALALEMRDDAPIDQIDRITIALHHDGWHEIGGGQGDHDTKKRPMNRETADHSLPFLVASALIDGEINLQSYRESRFRDSQMFSLMDRIEAVADATLTSKHAGEIPTWPSRLVIHLCDGRVLERHIHSPAGHPNNPLSELELRAKFDQLCTTDMSERERELLINTIYALPEASDLNTLLAQLRAVAHVA